MAKVRIVSYNARGSSLATEYGDTEIKQDIELRVHRLQNNKKCSYIMVNSKVVYNAPRSRK